MHFLFVMSRCACTNEVYSSRFCKCVCVCVCVCVCLFHLYLPICWKLSADTCNASVSQQYWPNVKKWLYFVMCLICSPRWLVGSDPDSCKGYPVFSRLISTLLFSLYHKCESGNLDRVACCQSLACYDVHEPTTLRCSLTCPHAHCITSSVYTLWNHNLIAYLYAATEIVLVSFPDHTLYASSERGSGVIHRVSWAGSNITARKWACSSNLIGHCSINT